MGLDLFYGVCYYVNIKNFNLKIYAKKNEIQVEVEDVSGKMFLKQHLGEGSFGDTKFDASFSLPTMSLTVSIGKKTYLISSEKLIKAIVEFDSKNK